MDWGKGFFPSFLLGRQAENKPPPSTSLPFTSKQPGRQWLGRWENEVQCFLFLARKIPTLTWNQHYGTHYTTLGAPKHQRRNSGGKIEFSVWGRCLQTHLVAGFRQWPRPGVLRTASQPLRSSEQSLAPLMVFNTTETARFRLCTYYHIPMG